MTKLTRGVPDSVGPQPKANRPDMKLRQPGNVLFADAGPTGWGRIRRLGDYSGGRSELDFRDQHHKFTEEGA